MKNLSNLSEKSLEYNKETIEELYVNKGYSWTQIAELYNSYPNKIRRQSIQWGIKSRTKAEAQSIALSSGRTKHPTKGTERSTETKIKISEKTALAWQNMSDEDKAAHVQRAKDQWANMTELERQNFQKLAGDAIRKSSREGSKLEKYLHTELTKAGYYVEYHKEHLILNEKLHLDMFLPKNNVVIEVDGMSHFEPVWGQKAFQRNKKADAEKSGLVLSRGLVLIRIKNTQTTLSEKYKRDILSKLLITLENIKQSYPSRENRLITL
jgi:very-short-patch-repair endonuclease